MKTVILCLLSSLGIASAQNDVLVGDPAANNRPSGGTPAWRYGVQTSVHGNGKIVKNPDQPGYLDREALQLTAVADDGYVFVGWTGDAVGLDNPTNFTMTKNLIVSAEFLPEAVGVILESSEAELKGSWANNSQKWAGQRSDSYAYVGASTDVRSSAIYRPILPKPGKYDIHIYYLQGDNRATKTRWEIVSKAGSSTVEVDQSRNGRAWFQIAFGIEFDAGTDGYVKVTSQAEPIPSVVIADSVAFVYSGPLNSK